MLPFQERLAREGFGKGGGESVQLTVAFDSCRMTPRSWMTVEKVPYRILRQIEIRKPRTEMHCSGDKTTVDRVEHVDVIRTTTTTVKGTCTEVETGEYYVDHVEEMMVDEIADARISHETLTIESSGSVVIETAAGPREARFAITAESFDNRTILSGIPEGGEVSDFTGIGLGNPESSARESFFVQARGEVWKLASAVLAEKVAAHVSRGQAAASAGDRLEADDQYFIANQIVRASKELQPAFAEWASTTYHMSQPTLAAAIMGGDLPGTSLAKEDVKIIPQTSFISDPAVQTFRSILTISFVGGVTQATVEGDAEAISGGNAAFHVDVLGMGFRLNGGHDGNHGNVDFDLYAGYGGWLGYLHLEPIVGLGFDFTTGNQDRLAPAPGDMRIPFAAYAELGGRIAYAAPRFAKIEAMYTKAFRTSSALPSQKRVEVRLIVSKLALNARYSEYLYDLDGLNPVFGEDQRAAKMLSLLGGFGF